MCPVPLQGQRCHWDAEVITLLMAMDMGVPPQAVHKAQSKDVPVLNHVDQIL